MLIKGKEAPKETQLAFGKLGITYDEVKKHGDDLPWMLDNIADGFKNGCRPPPKRSPSSRKHCSASRARNCCRCFDQGAKGIAEFERKMVERAASSPRR